MSNCTSGKVGYDNEDAALWAVQAQYHNRMQRNLPKIFLYVYACTKCPKFHLTKQRPKPRTNNITQEAIDAEDWLKEVNR